MGCKGFCGGGKETRLGLQTTKGDDLVSTFKGTKKLERKLEKLFDEYKCPLGFTHNPTSKKATVNMIDNGGRHSICTDNPWKWTKV